MKNIICIDLTQYTLQELKEVSKVFNIPFFYLEDLKGNPGEEVYFAKMWFDTLNQEIVGYSSILDKDKLVLSESYTDIISGIKPSELKKRRVDVLTVDNILDKIAKYGIDSLVKEEKDFLDNVEK
jgi:hypothetical protein